MRVFRRLREVECHVRHISLARRCSTGSLPDCQLAGSPWRSTRGRSCNGGSSVAAGTLTPIRSSKPTRSLGCSRRPRNPHRLQHRRRENRSQGGSHLRLSIGCPSGPPVPAATRSAFPGNTPAKRCDVPAAARPSRFRARRRRRQRPARSRRVQLPRRILPLSGTSALLALAGEGSRCPPSMPVEPERVRDAGRGSLCRGTPAAGRLRRWLTARTVACTSNHRASDMPVRISRHTGGSVKRSLAMEDLPAACGAMQGLGVGPSPRPAALTLPPRRPVSE